MCRGEINGSWRLAGLLINGTEIQLDGGVAEVHFTVGFSDQGLFSRCLEEWARCVSPVVTKVRSCEFLGRGVVESFIVVEYQASSPASKSRKAHSFWSMDGRAAGRVCAKGGQMCFL